MLRHLTNHKVQPVLCFTQILLWTYQKAFSNLINQLVWLVKNTYVYHFLKNLTSAEFNLDI